MTLALAHLRLRRHLASWEERGREVGEREDGREEGS